MKGKNNMPTLSPADGPTYHWQIELVPCDERDDGKTVLFTGTKKETNAKADRLADSAGFEILECILHRRGLA